MKTSSLSLPTILYATLLSSSPGVVEAFTSISTSSSSLGTTSFSSSSSQQQQQQQQQHHVVLAQFNRKSPLHSSRTKLFQTTDASTDDNDSSAAATTTADMTEMEASQTRETPQLTMEDKSFVQSIHAACSSAENADEAMETTIAVNLPNMHPRLVVALQMAAEKGEWKEQEEEEDGDEFEIQMVALGNALQNVLDVRLRSGRELLASLLDSGEIRKLDSMIGKAAKEGRLDTSFFTVLSMNMKDAAILDAQNGMDTSVSPTLAAGEGQEEVEGEEGRPTVGANRGTILQHIYTRAQEELEKNVDPGMGLLNKLLRTEISSIRANQLEYYLCPQKTTITSPDGQTIDLGGSGAPRIGHSEFTKALESTVDQIRTLESSGGTDRLSAMNLVESVRQVAMEARVVLVEGFGEGSEVVNEFQKELQPVFRPGSRV